MGILNRLLQLRELRFSSVEHHHLLELWIQLGLHQQRFRVHPVRSCRVLPLA